MENQFQQLFLDVSPVCQEWEVKRPDHENPSEEPYVDLIRVDEVHAKQIELRRAIDELMRAELEQLKDAVWREKNKSETIFF